MRVAPCSDLLEQRWEEGITATDNLSDISSGESKENKTAKRLNICLEWLSFSLLMFLVLSENTYMHLKMFLIGTIGWKNAELSIHWGLSPISVSCSVNEVRRPESLSLQQVTVHCRNVGLLEQLQSKSWRSWDQLLVEGPFSRCCKTCCFPPAVQCRGCCSEQELVSSKTCIISIGILTDGILWTICMDGILTDIV